MAGLFSGAVVGIASFVLCAAWLLHWEVNGVDERNARLSRNVQHGSLDVNNILRELSKAGPVSCTESEVVAMRRLLAKYRVIQGIGVIDSRGQVTCTTDLAKAPATTQAGAVSDVVADPGLPGQAPVRTIGIIRGPFGIALDPTVTNMLADQVDATWYGWNDTPALLNIRTERTDSQRAALQRALESHRVGYLDWSERSYIHTLRVPDTGFIIQSIIPLGIWAWPRLFPLTLLCLLLALAAGRYTAKIFSPRRR